MSSTIALPQVSFKWLFGRPGSTWYFTEIRSTFSSLLLVFLPLFVGKGLELFFINCCSLIFNNFSLLCKSSSFFLSSPSEESSVSSLPTTSSSCSCSCSSSSWSSSFAFLLDAACFLEAASFAFLSASLAVLSRSRAFLSPNAAFFFIASNLEVYGGIFSFIVNI